MTRTPTKSARLQEASNESESTPLLDSGLKQVEERPLVASKSQVYVLYGLATFQVLILTAVAPTLLLYLQYHGLASATDVSFYFVCTVIKALVPVFGNTGFGTLAARIGAPRTLAVLCVTCAMGLFGIIMARGRAMFAFAFMLYAMGNCGRTVRIVHLTRIVSAAQRTEIMSYHGWFSPAGGVIGPLVWLASTHFEGERKWGGIVLDKFSLNYLIAASGSLIMALVAYRFLEPAPYVSSTSTTNASTAGTRSNPPTSPLPNSVQLSMPDGTIQDIDTRQYRYIVVAYFCMLTICVNLTMSLFGETMQPILINHFGVGGKELGVIYESLMFIALIPPLIVAFMARHLTDRTIIVIGLCLKLIGSALYLPLFAPVRKWQVILGVTLMWKASTFFFTASMSLFTKLLGPLSNGTLLGVLSSSAALGYAVSQFIFGNTAVQMFDTLAFAVFSLPVVIALALVLWPSNWKMLHPERHLAQI